MTTYFYNSLYNYLLNSTIPSSPHSSHILPTSSQIHIFFLIYYYFTQIHTHIYNKTVYMDSVWLCVWESVCVYNLSPLSVAHMLRCLVLTTWQWITHQVAWIWEGKNILLFSEATNGSPSKGWDLLKIFHLCWHVFMWLLFF